MSKTFDDGCGGGDDDGHASKRNTKEWETFDKIAKETEVKIRDNSTKHHVNTETEKVIAFIDYSQLSYLIFIVISTVTIWKLIVFLFVHRTLFVVSWLETFLVCLKEILLTFHKLVR